jgi:hypothetical protein
MANSRIAARAINDDRTDKRLSPREGIQGICAGAVNRPRPVDLSQRHAGPGQVRGGGSGIQGGPSRIQAGAQA